VIPAVTPEYVWHEMPLVHALQYEILFWAKNGVDCFPYGEAQAIEQEIESIMGGQ
jgi:hypothetical protein